MSSAVQEPRDDRVAHFRVKKAQPQPDLSALATMNLHAGGLDDPGEFAEDEAEGAAAAKLVTPEELRTARRNIAAATARLPVTMEMAWTIPQLLKRIQVASPGTQSTNAVLRSLIRTPELDREFVQALTDSGFLSCDEVIARTRWKYDLAEMAAKHAKESDVDVLEQCRTVLWSHRMKQPFDWDAVLVELRTLRSWFPELRTIELLEQLYARLHALHVRSVVVAQGWLDRGASRIKGSRHA